MTDPADRTDTTGPADRRPWYRPGPLRPSTVMVMTIAVVAMVASLALWPTGPPPPTPDTATHDLRQPTGPTAGPGIATTAQAEPQDPTPEPAPFAHPIDPDTFLPPFADSVVVGDLGAICDIPAPADAIHVAIDGDDLAPGTGDRPLATIAEAVARVGPGQQILVHQGRYDESVSISGVSGRPDAWITLRSHPGERATLVGAIGRDSVALRRGSSYINIACLDLAGPALDPDAGPASPAEHRDRRLAGAGADEIPRNYGSGIDIGDRADTRDGLTSHHVRVIANRVRNYAEMGISAVEANHITIAGNTANGNAMHGCHAGSGIGLAYMVNEGGADNLDGYSNYIVGNVSYGNENRSLQCFSDSLGPVLTDGNGIIIDLNNSTDYRGRTLIADNLTFGNGGRGILVLRSSRVDIVNNTSYHNLLTDGLMGRDGPHPEIAISESEGSRVYNNIAVPRAGHIAFASHGIEVDRRTNLFPEPTDGTELFVAPGIDPATADFTPLDDGDWAEPGTALLVTVDDRDGPAVLSPVHPGVINTTGTAR